MDHCSLSVFSPTGQSLPDAAERCLSPNRLYFGPRSRFGCAAKVCWRLIVGVAVGLLALKGSAAEQSMVIDKGNSQIEIKVNVTIDSFVGTLVDYTPTVLVDSATGQIRTAKLAFHFHDVKTGNEKRDVEMNTWQQTEKFPEGAFILTTLVPSADAKLVATGALTLHGITHTLSFPVTLVRNGPAMTIDGDATVDTRTFGLPVIRKFAMLKVDPLVGVRFHLVGTLSAP